MKNLCQQQADSAPRNSLKRKEFAYILNACMYFQCIECTWAAKTRGFEFRGPKTPQCIEVWTPQCCSSLALADTVVLQSGVLLVLKKTSKNAYFRDILIWPYKHLPSATLSHPGFSCLVTPSITWHPKETLKRKLWSRLKAGSHLRTAKWEWENLATE